MSISLPMPQSPGQWSDSRVPTLLTSLLVRRQSTRVLGRTKVRDVVRPWYPDADWTHKRKASNVVSTQWVLRQGEASE